jgi:TrmH family RNA methyltransferase
MANDVRSTITDPLQGSPVIISPDNPKLKELRRLAKRRDRDKLGLFAAEGEDLVMAAQAAGYVARSVFVPGNEATSMPESLRPIPVEDELLASSVQLASSTRAVGVYKQRWLEPAEIAALQGISVCLWGVGDPGNVGTIIRSADAFAADAVVLGPQSADPFSPKAVRASMGAIFSTPVGRVRSIGDLPGVTVALVAEDGEPLHEAMPRLVGHGGPITLVVGAEREGIPGEIARQCGVRVTIPMARDSVNAAMAATIALYETARATTPSVSAPTKVPAA